MTKWQADLPPAIFDCVCALLMLLLGLKLAYVSKVSRDDYLPLHLTMNLK